MHGTLGLQQGPSSIFIICCVESYVVFRHISVSKVIGFTNDLFRPYRENVSFKGYDR